MGSRVNKATKNRDILISFDMLMPHEMILISCCDGPYVV